MNVISKGEYPVTWPYAVWFKGQRGDLHTYVCLIDGDDCYGPLPKPSAERLVKTLNDLWHRANDTDSQNGGEKVK